MHRFIVLVAFVLTGVAAPPRHLRAQRNSAIRPLAHTRVVLSNGLVVLLNEDHSSPVIGVEVLYHFGAKDEPAGKTGYAHICEHLMGQGSPNVPQLAKYVIESVGGSSFNFPAAWASTDEDRTHYFFSIPSNQLETALWVESDRMAAPLTRADSEHFKPVREVVRQERIQNRESRTFGEADRLTIDQFFVGQDRRPREALGPMADLDAATANDAKQFCLPYYVPNNAIVALSGDFRTADAERLVRKCFGSIPRGAKPSHPVVAPTALTSEKRLVLEDQRAKVPRLRMVWYSAGFSVSDRLALNALAALLAPADPRVRQLLPGADRAGHLSKVLVYDRQLATSVTASNIDLETAGLFQIEVTPRGDASMSVIEAVVDSVLTAVKNDLVNVSELGPYKQATTVIGTASLQTRRMRADTLAQGEAYAGDPLAYAKQAQRTLGLTPEDVRAVARKYLTPGRVVMSMIPAGKLDLVSKPSLPFTNVTPVKSLVP